MSTVSVAEVKQWLRVIHSADDGLIKSLIDQAEDEALRFLNRQYAPTLPLDYPCSSEDIPSSEDPAAPSYVRAVCILVQASYEVAEPEKQAQMRRNAETVLFPYRTKLGI